MLFPQPVRGDHRPRLPRVYVPRTLLWDRLDAATPNALTLLVGPMGSGKSLGVSGWLESRGDEDAQWIAADAGWEPARVQEALLAAQDPEAPAPRLVVVDDAHLLPLASVRLIDERLNEAPESLRVLLVSRWDLPITRLGAELLGHFTVLRGELLRLDERDSATLVAEHARTDSVEVARAVTEHTQGWCAAVVLTARSLAATRDPLVAARRLRDQESPVADAVAAEVFASLPAQDRHLLLCVANEEIVSVDTARHLTGDPEAAATLAELETTGLMVTRVGDGATDGLARYRIHPLLAEVVRRRIAAGGEDVERARSAVLRAVRLDAARGDSSRAFRRLLGLNHPEAAAQVLAADAPELIAHDGGAAVRTFVRQHPVVVEDHPDAWFAVCAERWFDDDIPQALHWMDKLVQLPPEQRARLVGEIACVQLMRARLGLEPLEESVTAAELVLRDQASSLSLAVLLQLRVELGIVQTWLGQLDAAQANLAEAIRIGRSSVLPAYAASAMSHLAFTYFAQGRGRACARHGHRCPRGDGERAGLASPDDDRPRRAGRPAGRPEQPALAGRARGGARDRPARPLGGPHREVLAAPAGRPAGAGRRFGRDLSADPADPGRRAASAATPAAGRGHRACLRAGPDRRRAGADGTDQRARRPRGARRAGAAASLVRRPAGRPPDCGRPLRHRGARPADRPAGLPCSRARRPGAAPRGARGAGPCPGGAPRGGDHHRGQRQRRALPGMEPPRGAGAPPAGPTGRAGPRRVAARARPGHEGADPTSPRCWDPGPRPSTSRARSPSR